MSEEGGAFFIGGEGDVPEEIRKFLQHAVGATIFSDNVHERIANEVMPNEEQLSLGEGDTTIISSEDDAHSSTEFQVLKIMDPSEHADDFPDWEERLFNSYVFGQWYDADNLVGEYGWFPRVNLIKINDEQWDRVMNHIAKKERMTYPEVWLIERYNHTIVGLAKANPGSFPVPMTCGECGRLTVTLDITGTKKKSYTVGTFTDNTDRDPQGFYSCSSSYVEEDFVGQLHCLGCGFKLQMNLEEHNIYLGE